MLSFKSIYLHVCFCILLQLSCNDLLAQNYKPKIDSLLNAYVALNKLNGTVLVYSKGAVIYNSSYGYADKSSKKPITENCIFPIGSLTKSFTATIILKLAEREIVSLDDRLSRFIPDYPRGEEITIRHLLTHTSGVFEVFENPDYMRQLYKERKYGPDTLMTFFKTKPLQFDPGTKFSYSNSGYDLLGIIIELATGKTYAHNLQEYIFKPLNMLNSGFDYRAISANRVTGYSYLSRSKQVVAEYPNPGLLYSSGALYSNTKDLIKFYKGFKSGKLLKKELFNSATTVNQGGYGLGWFIDIIDKDTVINHGGNLEGFTSYFLMNPERDICIVLLSNTTSTTLERIGNTLYKVITRKPYLLPKPKQEIALSKEKMYALSGLYHVSAETEIKVTVEDGKLFLQINHEKKLKLSAETEYLFFIEGEDMEIEFISVKGQVTEIKLKQGLSTKYGDKVIRH
jgi:CubicO group peptidase (beta-lactamase class C family)